MAKRIFSKRAKSVLFSSLGITTIIGAIPVSSALILDKLNVESNLKLANNQNLREQVSAKTAPNYGQISYDNWMQLKDTDANNKQWSSLQQSSPFTMKRDVNGISGKQNIPNTRALIGTNSGIITYKQKQGLFKIPYDGSEVVPGNGIDANFRTDFTTNLDYVWQMQYMADSDIVAVLSSTTSTNNLRLSLWKSENMKFLGAENISNHLWANAGYQPNPNAEILTLVPLFNEQGNVNNKFVIYGQNQDLSQYNFADKAQLLVVEINVQGVSNSITIKKIHNTNSSIFNNTGTIISSAFYGIRDSNKLQAISIVANENQKKMEVINYEIALENGIPDGGLSSIISRHNLVDKSNRNVYYNKLDGLNYGRVPSNGIINISKDGKYKQIAFQVMGNYDKSGDKFDKFAHLYLTLEKDLTDNTKWKINSSNKTDANNGNIGILKRNLPQSDWKNRSSFLENNNNDTGNYGAGSMAPRFIVANSNTKIYYGISNRWSFVNFDVPGDKNHSKSYNNFAFIINAANYFDDPIDGTLVKAFHKGPRATNWTITNPENKYFLVPDVSVDSTEMPKIGFIETNDQKINGVGQNRLKYHRTNMDAQFDRRPINSSSLDDRQIFPKVQGKVSLFNNEEKIIPLSDIKNDNPSNAGYPIVNKVDPKKLKSQIAFLSEESILSVQSFELTTQPGTLKLNVELKGSYDSTTTNNLRIWDGTKFDSNVLVDLGFIMVSGFDSILDISSVKATEIFNFTKDVNFDSWNWNLLTEIDPYFASLPEKIVNQLELKWQIKNNNQINPLQLNKKEWYSAKVLKDPNNNQTIKDYMNSWDVVVKFKLGFKETSTYKDQLRLDETEYTAMDVTNTKTMLTYNFDGAKNLLPDPQVKLSYTYNVDNNNQIFKEKFPLKFWAEESLQKTKITFDTEKAMLNTIKNDMLNYGISSIEISGWKTSFPNLSGKINFSDIFTGIIKNMVSFSTDKVTWVKFIPTTNNINNGEYKFSDPSQNGPNWIFDFKIDVPIKYDIKYDGKDFQIKLVSKTTDSLQIKLVNDKEPWKNVLEAQFQADFLALDEANQKQWYNSIDFTKKIEEKYATGLDGWINLSDLNISMKLVLKDPDLGTTDTKNGIRYIWTKDEQLIFEKGKKPTTLPDIFYSGTTSIVSKINTDNWDTKFSFSVGGDKDTAVILKYGADSQEIDFNVYSNKGVQLERSWDGTTNWVQVPKIPSDPIDASKRPKMHLRLKQITGEEQSVEFSKQINITIDVVAKKHIQLDSNLFKTEVIMSGTTHNSQINTDKIYNSLDALDKNAKNQLELRFSINKEEKDNTNWKTKVDFINYLTSLRNDELNNLNPQNFGVAWFFKKNVKQTVYSNQIFNGGQYNPSTNRDFKTDSLIKSLDLTAEKNAVATYQVSGETKALVYAVDNDPTNLLNQTAFTTKFKGLQIEYGKYTKQNNQWTYQWSSTRPSTLETIEDPITTDTHFPLAIRFSEKTTTTNNKFSLIRFDKTNSNTAILLDTEKECGYEIDLSKVTQIINVDAAFIKLSSLKLSGTVAKNDLTINEKIVKDEIDSLFQDKITIKYQLSNGYYNGNIDKEKWLTLAELKENLKHYTKDYNGQNSNLAILSLFNANNQSGLKISAKFVPANTYSVSNPNSQAIDTNSTKVELNLSEYVEFLKKIELHATGTSVLDPGIISIKEKMSTSRTGFLKNKEFSAIKTALKNTGINIKFQAKNPTTWVDELISIKELEDNATIKMKFELQNKEITLTPNTEIILQVKVPKNINISSTIIKTNLTLSGNTKHLVIDETKVKSDPSFSNNPYKAVVTIEYAIGTTQSETDLLALSTTEPTKKWFTQIEFTNALKNYNQDITQAQKNIFTRFALIKGTPSQDYRFSDNAIQKLDQIMNTIKIFVHDKGLFSLLKDIKISGSAENLKFEFPAKLQSIANNSDQGLQFVWTINSTATATDIYNNSSLWTETRPTKLEAATNHYLAIAIKSKSGYVYEKEYPDNKNNELQQLDTTAIFTLINLQNSWLKDVLFTGNTFTTNINEDNAKKLFAHLDGANEIVIQYSYDQKTWFAKDDFINKLKEQNGKKDEQNFILLRDEIKARYSLTANGFNKYRLVIDGTNVPSQFPTDPNLFQDVIKANSKNDNYKGYINLAFIKNIFNINSFLITGTTKDWKFEVTNENLITKLHPYQNKKIFDIYYTVNRKNNSDIGDYTLDENHKLFNNNGFIENPTNKDPIKADEYFSIVLVPTDKYELNESNRQDLGPNNKKGFEISKLKTNLIIIVNSPLQGKLKLAFNGYQGQGSVSSITDDTNKDIFTILNDYTENGVKPIQGKYEIRIHISDINLSDEQILEIKNDSTKWTGYSNRESIPANFKVGQYVLAWIRPTNDKLQITNIDASDPKPIKVENLKVNVDEIKILKESITYSNRLNSIFEDKIDGDIYVSNISLDKSKDNNKENYLGVDLQIWTKVDYYKKNGHILYNPSNSFPLVKREQSEKKIELDVVDDANQKAVIYLNNQGLPTTPIEKNPYTLAATLSRSQIENNSFLLSDFTTNLKGLLFNNQSFKIVPVVADGFSVAPEDKDKLNTKSQEFKISNAKYPILSSNSVKVSIDDETLNNIKYISKSESGVTDEKAIDGQASISSKIILRFADKNSDEKVEGEEARTKLKKEFNDKLRIDIKHEPLRGTSTSFTDSVDLSKFTNLKNGDKIIINIVSNDNNYINLENQSLVITVAGLIRVGPSDKSLDNLRWLENQGSHGQNGKGAFRMTLDPKADLVNIAADKTAGFLRNDFTFEYRIWDENKNLVTRVGDNAKGWNKEYPQSLKNGYKVEWKLVSLGIGATGGDIINDYYNTIFVKNDDATKKGEFWQVLVDENGQKNVNKGIGQYSYEDDKKEYPENTGFIFTNLYEEITISKEDAQLLSEIKLDFSGTNGSGRFTISDEIQAKMDELLNRSGIQVRFLLNGKEITDKDKILSNNDVITIDYKFVGKPGEEFKNVVLVGNYQVQSETVKNLTIPNSLSNLMWSVSAWTAGGFVVLVLAGVILYKVARNRKLKGLNLFRK